MRHAILATCGAAVLAAGCLAGAADAAILAQPGETMGVALGKPLPEGVFFVDLESYGKRDGQNQRLGVNIPIVAWSTPFTFYDTRLEILYAAPFLHFDGVVNRTDIYSQGLLFVLAHDFGNGFAGSVIAGPRTEDGFANSGRGVLGDFRTSISYTGPMAGLGPINANATFHYQGNFGGSNGVNLPIGFSGYDDNIFVDYSLTKTFDKLEAGFVGTAYTDIGGPNPVHGAGVAIGGLLGYDFGKVTLQAMVTREVLTRNGGYGTGPLALPNIGGHETRGWLRVIIPLYVAPKATPVVARY